VRGDSLRPATIGLVALVAAFGGAPPDQDLTRQKSQTTPVGHFAPHSPDVPVAADPGRRTAPELEAASPVAVPMPHIEARRPGPVPMPEVEPRRPGPLPMPERADGTDPIPSAAPVDADD